MIWVLISDLHKPRLWLRMLVDCLLLLPLGYMLYLGWFDRQRPFEITSGVATPAIVRAGEDVEIQWRLKELRYCPTVRSMRALQSRVDPDWIHVVGELQPHYDPDTPRPLTRPATSQPIRVPRNVPFEPGAERTTLYWAVDVRAACNWFQELLPESWWISFPLPRVPIEVERAIPRPTSPQVPQRG